MLRMLAIALLALLAACSRGPDQASLEADLQQRLEQAFPATSLSLSALQRRGSASDVHAPDGERRVLIYFDAELRVERDQDFGSWDSPGVASLMVDGVTQRDMPLVQTCAMLFCAAYLALVTLADIVSIVANPRLRYR